MSLIRLKYSEVPGKTPPSLAIGELASNIADGTLFYGTKTGVQQFAFSGGTMNTGSLLLTASAAMNTITFTKGNGSTFAITVDTGSGGTTNTGSLLLTASVSLNTITFTKGNGNTFPITVNTGSGSPGGPNTSIQFNGNGVFSGSSAFTFNSGSNVLTLTGSLTLISGSDTDTLINIKNSASPNTFIGLKPDRIVFNAAGYATEILNPQNANGVGSVRLPAQNSDLTLITSINGDYADNQGAISLPFATTGSNTFIGNQTITGSLLVSGSGITVTGSLNAANITGSLFGTASYVTGSIFTSTNPALSASYAITASYALNAGNTFTLSNGNGTTANGTAVDLGGTLSSDVFIDGALSNYSIQLGAPTNDLNTFKVNASGQQYILDSTGHSLGGNVAITNGTTRITGSLSTTGSVLFRGLTTSNESNVITINTSTGQLYYTASSAFGGGSGTGFPFNGNAVITGSLLVSGSSGGFGGITGSLQGTSSWANNALTASYAFFAVTSSYPISVTGSGTTLYSVSPLATPNFGAGSTHSIFFGQEAGYLASDAYYANFLGRQAGYQADFAEDSNFLGFRAGFNATYADRSNLFGNNAGGNAAYASQSNFFGHQAGFEAYTASNSNFLGYQAGFQAAYANDSTFIGYQAGYLAYSASNSTFIGNSAGVQAYFASNSIFIGSGSGNTATNANNSIFIGSTAGKNASSTHSIYIGTNAGNATAGGNSIIIGRDAGSAISSTSNSVLIGYQAGKRITSTGIGNNNIIIGTNITLANSTVNSINIGGILFGTGSYSDTTTNPFSGSAGGRIGINVVSPIYTLDVSGSGNFNNNLTVTGSFTVITGSAVELQVTNTGVKIGNIVTDTHTITGSLNISGSLSTSDTFTTRGNLIVSGNTTLGDTSGDTITLNASTIALSGSGTGTLNIDSNTFFINANTNRVSIGTATPSSSFHVNLNNTDFTNTNGAGSHFVMTNPSATGQNVISSFINGTLVAKWRTDYEGNISWVSAGSVGKQDFYTKGDFGVGNIQMRIHNSGNITMFTAPLNVVPVDRGFKLEISGSGASGSFNANNVLRVSGSIAAVTGSLIVTGSATITGSLLMPSGSNTRVGTSTLVAGNVLVNNTTVTANSLIFLTAQNTGGTPGALYIAAKTAATSFAVSSSSNTDTSTFAYFIIN